MRYDEKGRVIGLTLVNARWLAERDGVIEFPIRVTADDLTPALASLLSALSMSLRSTGS